MTSHCSETCEPIAVLADQGANELPAQLHIGHSYFTSVGLSEDVLPNLRCTYNFCKEGQYCPEASTNATEHDCGDAGLYCPTGSELPTAVSMGYYTIGELLQ